MELGSGAPVECVDPGGQWWGLERCFFLFIFFGFLHGPGPLIFVALAAEKSCSTTECHAGVKNQKFGSMHSPLKSGGDRSCRICHPSGDDNPVRERMPSHPRIRTLDHQDMNQTCFLCHEERKHELASLPFKHQAIQDKGCLSCHTPHSSSHAKLLRHDPRLDLCLNCHEKQKTVDDAIPGTRTGNLDSGPFHHRISTMKEGCLSCHQSHGSKYPNLLVEKPGLSLCQKCHQLGPTDKSRSAMAISGSSDPGRPAPLAWLGIEEKFWHEPVAKGECTKCHEVHGSNTARLLKKDIELSPFVARHTTWKGSLCFECHESQQLVGQARGLGTGFRNGDLNLHYLHLRQSPSETSNSRRSQKTCTVCHDPHAGKTGGLVREQFEYLGIKVPLLYQRTPQGGTCTTACHQAQTYDRKIPFVNSPVWSSSLENKRLPPGGP